MSDSSRTIAVAKVKMDSGDAHILADPLLRVDLLPEAHMVSTERCPYADALQGGSTCRICWPGSLT